MTPLIAFTLLSSSSLLLISKHRGSFLKFNIAFHLRYLLSTILYILSLKAKHIPSILSVLFRLFGIETISAKVFNEKTSFFSEIYMTSETFVNALFNVQQGGIFIDVGAYLGIYTIRASKMVGANGKVISIEADPQNYQRLLKNLKLNKCENVITVNKALSDKHGLVKLYLSSDPDGHSLTGRSLNKILQKYVLIESITLDSLLELLNIQHVDLMKIDVEGAEFYVLLGGEKSLHKIKQLIIEVHPWMKQEMLKLLKLLYSYGFTLVIPREIYKNKLLAVKTPYHIYAFRHM